MKLQPALETAERISKNTRVFLQSLTALDDGRDSYVIYVRLADGKTIHQVSAPEDWPPPKD